MDSEKLEIVALLENKYDSCIERLSKDRQALKNWKTNFGQTAFESKLIQLLKINDT